MEFEEAVAATYNVESATYNVEQTKLNMKSEPIQSTHQYSDYEKKFKDAELKYSMAKEQLAYYKNEVKTQVVLKRNTKKELLEVLKQRDHEVTEKVRVLKELDAFLKQHEVKMKCFIDETNEKVGKLQMECNVKETTIQQQVVELQGKEDKLNDVNASRAEYEKDVIDKDHSLVSLEKEVISQWDEITKLKETANRLRQENRSLESDRNTLQQAQQRKWYHRFMFWRNRPYGCFGDRPYGCFGNRPYGCFGGRRHR